MPILVCHIGWMAACEGKVGQPDDIVGGGAWVRKHRDGGETCNFLECEDGYVYGHVETVKGKRDRPISIELLGAKQDAGGDHVDVVWTATDPKRKGRWVVGWYRDARVYREREYFKKSPSAEHRLEKHKENYRVRTRAENAVLIPPKQRDIQLGRGKGWIGQANWWFPEKQSNGAIRRFVETMRKQLDARPDLNPGGKGGPGGKWGGKSDPLRNAQVEAAAILKVREHFAGYKIESVEKDNLGWDLEARPKGATTPLRLEVKGLFGQELKVGLTPREYRAFQKHIDGSMPGYRLCVVTGALSSKPKLVVFRYDPGEQRWVDDCLRRKIAPKIDPVQAAIVSLV
ncbi:hypothetical protein ACVIHI_007969 [Bradyrhizobium sp. USDA 4524]|uniref:protein NO VEIN domain-containing protein n=1 Tax=unclassified Bradyrhizobium TaxID=2631580 RepID=UPI00209D97DD|nr:MULTISPECIES: DUF3883 domain-containing protein [unclassified Bradyrhizobium]MCP1839117.1 hypothetical protein [Bradyrhizobium sp. USDA 4538]MCP1899682.1 hypothetical protein [Bradyrhizobium sp. USDA 4537]MCP1986208.1 hypothetical protein [Bradyrhizobium sp. USDA 4539]